MRVDFYQLGDTPAEQVAVSLSQKVLESGQRLLIVAAEEACLGRIDRLLWDQGPASFLPHGVVGSGNDAGQPVLLSRMPDAPNRARNILIADGEWREAALSYDRAFYLFGPDSTEGARLAWKLLAGRDGVERRYWDRGDDGRWSERG